VAQDDYYYEIQLTNKQLVFYFLAGATGLVLSFLAGVMVGRGVDQTASAAESAQVAQHLPEDRIVTEEPPTTRPAPPGTEDLTYAQRLESDKMDTSLSSAGAADSGNAKPAAPPASVAAKPPATLPASKPAPPTTVAARPPVTTPKTPPTTLAAAAKPATAGVAPGAFTIQVGAFKDRATADSMVGKLKAKGFAAYVMTPAGGNAQLFNVRVGSFQDRPEAERVQAKLRDEEKFKPFIVRN
jgi:cell division septation protein DedD